MKRPETAEEILAWLNERAVRVDFQNLGARVIRQKNRVIVSYHVPSGHIVAVGGRDLRSAVVKAAMRIVVAS